MNHLLWTLMFPNIDCELNEKGKIKEAENMLSGLL